jgi:tetratricopeptide (TPR) repeat protein
MGRKELWARSNAWQSWFSYTRFSRALQWDKARECEAIEACRKALTIRESLAKLDPNDARYKFSLATNYVSLANILTKAHRRAEAISNLTLALAVEKSLAAKDPYNALVARALSDTERSLHLLTAR